MGSKRDKLKRRVRKTVKWGGAVVTVLLLVVWIGSGWREVAWSSPSGLYAKVRWGFVGISWAYGTPVWNRVNVFETSTYPFRLDWSPHVYSYQTGWFVSIPLWIPILLSIVATAVAWRSDWRKLPRFCTAVRKTVKWGGAAVTLALLLGLHVSRTTGYSWNWHDATAERSAVVCGGAVHVMRRPRNTIPDIERRGPWTGDLPISWEFKNYGNGAYVIVSLWPLPLLSLLATAIAWRVDAVYGRRARVAAVCPSCGYDRAGLAAGSLCPECGVVPSA